ncbi:MAG: hypothetical protein R2730_10620 [Chitinophagales bacterium]
MKVLKIILLLALIAAVYVVGSILYGTFTDYQPEEKIVIEPSKTSDLAITKDSLVFYIWNIGYAGLGAESDFFMDGGSSTRVSKDLTNKNLNGIQETVSSWKDADFILLQEVDETAKRSYGVNQFTSIEKGLPENWSGALAFNYRVNYIPVPLLKPYGKVMAGLATYTPYHSIENTRYQFPGKFSWPKRIFFLDRCFLIQRFPINGKELLVINTHNSAYDSDGTLKAGEMAYLKAYITEEYEKGNYVLVGGDWNQCPPGYDCYGDFTPEEVGYEQNSIADDYMPADWHWGFDANTKTNRKLEKAYEKGKTFTTVIDFYLLSPNIDVVKVQGQDLDFQFSDHQPVRLEIKLK